MLLTQTEANIQHNAVECGVLRSMLDASTYLPVFAGDVNRKPAGDHCAPARYYGLKDIEWSSTDRTATSGLQHIYWS